jgi:hypothetical protein
VLPEPGEYLQGCWEERNWRNVPGPFYGADTDNCFTGRQFAPRHVLYDDEHYQEFVYRQPASPAQVHDLLNAACSEVFCSYGCDGDEYWTPAAVREWWRDQQRLLEWIYRARDRWQGSPDIEERDLFAGLVDFHRSVRDGSLEAYLRGYMFWLDNRRPPATNDLVPPL